MKEHERNTFDVKRHPNQGFGFRGFVFLKMVGRIRMVFYCLYDIYIWLNIYNMYIHIFVVT